MQTTTTKSERYLLVCSSNGWVIAYSEIYPYLEGLLTPGYHIERESVTVTTTTTRTPYTP
jgi:hypothetical protein